ncbi:MAG: Asp-tRNA(Asn)/Glu-tRNA(Gln) amidotransferase subunit GatC [Thermodesulfovibrionales bacterium]
MNISIEHLARLARLSLDDREKELFAGQLGSVLDYVNTLTSLDTSLVEPTSHVLDLRNVVRPDVVRPSLDRAEALGNAPDRTEKFYRVPRIIE